jgi:hypothetical protein
MLKNQRVEISTLFPRRQGQAAADRACLGSIGVLPRGVDFSAHNAEFSAPFLELLCGATESYAR